MGALTFDGAVAGCQQRALARARKKSFLLLFLKKEGLPTTIPTAAFLWRV
jgi:hypothetical protein